jgi:Leucine-rich repeat (LRR) protein
MSFKSKPIHHFKFFFLCYFFLQKFVNMRELNLDYCQYLTEILDVSCLPNVETLSFTNCKNLITIHDSVGFLNKLKTLNAMGCSKLKSFPPIKLTSLQQLQLSFCESLESFPEILCEMENITNIDLMGTSIEEFLFSFQNLTGLRVLQILGGGTFRLPSRILTMPTLSLVIAWGCLLPKKNDILSSMAYSNVQELCLPKCNLSDEFLPITWFANLEELDLSRNNFTILPECITECHFLRTLLLDYCKCLREIRGIPPNLKCFSAFGCESMTSSCRSMLLNQVLFSLYKYLTSYAIAQCNLCLLNLRIND